MTDVGRERVGIEASRGSRWVLLAAGHTFVALGVIGAFLPIMPTTVFLILAASCYGKASPALHRKLLAHRTFGPVVRDWEEHRAMSVKAKAVAIVMIVAAFAGSYFAIPLTWIRIIHVVTGLALITFILRVRTRRAD